MEKNSKGQKRSVKDEIKAGVRPKKTTIDKAVKPKKQIAPTDKVEDNVAALPEQHQKVYVKANEIGETKSTKVDINTITATSQCVYVADIHSKNVQVLSTVYWVIMPNTQHVVLRLSQAEYEKLLQRKEAKSMNHLYSVVDCAVFPSITYGSWKLRDIANFPTPEQIDEYDAKFRTMDVRIHNQPVIAELLDAEAEVAATTVEDEDDAFEIDFSEEDEFDFEED